MAFIKAALNDVKEGEPVPEGEYDLRIVSAVEGKSKKDNDMVTVTIVVEDPDYPAAFPVRHWLTVPAPGADPKSRYLQELETKRFLDLFGVPWTADGYDTEDLIGATARATLIQEEADDGNIYNRLRLPRLKK